MPCPPRRPTHLQLELFMVESMSPMDGAPAWTTLPDQTRRTLTGLVTRMLIAHAAVAAPEPEGDGGDL